MMWRSLVALCGCAGSAAGPPPPPAAPPIAPRPTARPAPRIEPTSCRDAAIILRGSSDEAATSQIEAVCVEDGWSQRVLDCIGELASKHDGCLDELAPEHRQRYDEQLAATRLPPHLECEHHVGRAEAYVPSLDVFAGQDRTLLLQLRRLALEERCVVDMWEQPALRCFATGRDPAICRGLLAHAQEAAIVAALAQLQTLGTKLVAAQQRPAALACKTIAATHYSDRAWANKASALEGTARRQAIATLRTYLARSCTDERWSQSLRACIAVGTMATCLRGDGRRARWDFAPLATSFGIAECDQLARTVTASLRCDKVKQIDTREIIDEARERLRKGAPSAEIAERCDDGLAELTDRMASAGCKP